MDKKIIPSRHCGSSLRYAILLQNDILGLSMLETALKINNIEHPNMFTKQGKNSKKFEAWAKRHLVVTLLRDDCDKSGKYPNVGYLYVEDMSGDNERVICLFTSEFFVDLYHKLRDLNKGGEDYVR